MAVARELSRISRVVEEVKIKYKIYPKPDETWAATWDLTLEQRRAADHLSWWYNGGYAMPRYVKSSYLPRFKRFKFIKRRMTNIEEHDALAAACERYAQKICDRRSEERHAEELRTAAPIIEYGCDRDVQP